MMKKLLFALALLTSTLQAQITVMPQGSGDIKFVPDGRVARLGNIAPAERPGQVVPLSQLQDTLFARIQAAGIPTGTAAAKDTGQSIGRLNPNGAVLANSAIVETSSTGRFITATKATGYNRDFGSGSTSVMQGNDLRVAAMYSAYLVIQDAITISFDTMNTMCCPVSNAWYKLIDAAVGTANPDSFPIYIQYLPSVGFSHGIGYMEMPDVPAYNLFPVIFNNIFNYIHEFRDPNRDILVRDLNFISGGLLTEGNAMKAAIHFTHMAYDGTIPQWQYINWDGATVNYNDDMVDLEYVSIKMDPSSTLTLDTTDGPEAINTTVYYMHQSLGSSVYIGGGTILLWIEVGQQASLIFGRHCRTGADQGLGPGSYYFQSDIHSNTAIGDSGEFNEYQWFKPWSTTIIGNAITANGPLVIGADANVMIGAHCTFNGMLNIYDHAVVAIPDNTTWGEAHIWGNDADLVGGSTLSLTLDVGADTTPDAVTVKYAGFTTITCTSSSITITTLQALRPNTVYEFIIANGKTITMDSGSFFKLNGGVDFVGNGTNGDRIILKTNANSSAAYEISRANY